MDFIFTNEGVFILNMYSIDLYKHNDKALMVSTEDEHSCMESKSIATPQHYSAYSFAVSIHVPANCQLPSIARLANLALFHMGNKARVLLVRRDVTKSLKCNTHCLTSSYTTLYCPNIR